MNDVQTDAWGGKKIRAAIIEDELPAARLLQGMLAELRPQWDIQLLPGTIEEAVQWFATHPHPDILFLDIQLTDGLSFYFIEQARPESMIVFTTAYDEYAVRAFTVNSIDYLLKPVRRERLADSLEKFERLTAPRICEQNERMDMQELLRMLADRNACPYRKRFLVNGARSLYTLAVDDVCYFYSEEKVTFAVTADRARTSSTCRSRSWKSSSTRAASFVSAASSSFRLIASATSSLTSTARWWCTSRLPLMVAFR